MNAYRVWVKMSDRMMQAHDVADVEDHAAAIAFVKAEVQGRDPKAPVLVEIAGKPWDLEPA